MLILTVRTDKPESEIGLYEDNKKLAYEKWQAHRQLSQTIHKKIQYILSLQGASLQKVGGVVCFKGPGSFTGLRIGFSVANTIAYSLGVPIVSASGDDWIEDGVRRLKKGEDEKISVPNYGSEAFVSSPKK